MKTLNFFGKYKEFLQQGKKTTTVRIGDRSDKYKIRDLIKITVDHTEHMADGKIVSVEVKKLGEIKDENLVGESPDSITRDLLIKSLNETYSNQLKRNVTDEDIVTIIKWEYI